MNNCAKFIALFFIISTLFSCTKREEIKIDHLPQFFSVDQKSNSTVGEISIYDSSKNLIQQIQFDENGVAKKPIERLALFSTTYHPMIELLKATEKVAAIDSVRYSNSTQIVQNVKEGKIIECGELPNIDIEKLILAKVDAIFLPPISLPNALKEKLSAFNIRYFYFNEFLEASPLARAKWLEVAAILLGKKEDGEKIYSEIEKKYFDRRTKIASDLSDGEKIKVLTGYPFNDIWGVASQNSYIATLIKEAGGEPINFEKKLKLKQQFGSILLSVEQVYIASNEAEVWLINTADSITLKKIESQFPILKNISAYKNQLIFNPTKKINSFGGNDFYEHGVFSPDLILNDLHLIFSAAKNKTQFDEEQSVFFKQVK